MSGNICVISGCSSKQMCPLFPYLPSTTCSFRVCSLGSCLAADVLVTIAIGEVIHQKNCFPIK